MQMYTDGHKIVIENIDDPKDIVCDGDCENCPIADIDCDGDCEDCPCSDNCDESEANCMTKLYRVLGKRGRSHIRLRSDSVWASPITMCCPSPNHRTAEP